MPQTNKASRPYDLTVLDLNHHGFHANYRALHSAMLVAALWGLKRQTTS